MQQFLPNGRSDVPICSQPAEQVQAPTEQPRTAKRPSCIRILFLSIAIATVLLVAVMMMPETITSRLQSAPGPTVTVKPTATPRPPCNKREEVTKNLRVLLVSLTQTADFDIREIRSALDDDHDFQLMEYGGSQSLDHETGKIRCIQTDAVGSDQSLNWAHPKLLSLCNLPFHSTQKGSAK